MTILITGGAGFIGSNFIKLWISSHNEIIINLDKLSYVSNMDTTLIRDKNYKFIKGNIGDVYLVKKLLETYKPRIIINFAAETHVDRSILNPDIFIRNNVSSFLKFINSCNNYWKSLGEKERVEFRFIQISTDEVYGSLENNEKPFTENDQYQTSNIYSASKASANHIAQAFYQTYKFPVIITISVNNYGPYQFYEKFIPKLIKSALNNLDIPIYGNGQQIRDWIYVIDHCRAIIELIKYGIPGESYNIGDNNEITNLELAIYLCNILDRQYPKKDFSSYKNQIKFVEDRPGHDKRYSINPEKIKTAINWKALESIKSGMNKTVAWYISNIVDRTK